jgi:hypothetical protein
MKTKIIDGRVFFETAQPEKFDELTKKIYEDKFQELREQMKVLTQELEQAKSYFIQLAYGYYTNTEKTELARAALKRMVDNEV